MRRLVVLCCSVLAAGVVASQAAAYCYYDSLLWQRDGEPLEAIPVYLDFGPIGDLKRTGLSETTIISYTMTIIEEFNRSAVTAPRLYFGGVRRPDHLVTVSNLPDGAGIHIRAALCSSDDVDSDGDGTFDDDPGATGVTNRGGSGDNRATIRLRTLLTRQGALCPVFEPWNTVGALAINGGIVECAEPFPGVFNPAKGYCIPYKDYKGVVLHEMLHAVGLHHHQLDSCQCIKAGGTHSDDVVPTWGSVRSAVHVADGSGRTLWRDDIEGLEALFTLHGDAPQSWKVVEYASQTGASWDALGVVPLAQQVTAPVAASSSTDMSDSTLVLAYAGEDRFVRVARRQGAGGSAAWSDLGAVDPDTIVVRSDARNTPAGVTYQRPAVAYAPANDDHPARVAVAWLFEDETVQKAQIRWGLRDLSGGAWTLAGVGGLPFNPIFVTPRIVNLGYDPVNDFFLLTYFDGDAATGDPRQYGYVQALSATTGGKVGAAQLVRPIAGWSDDGPGEAVPGVNPFREVMHDIGKPACYAASGGRCAIPMATSGPNGPCLGWYNGTRTDDGLGWASLERTIFCMRDWGLNDLSLDPGEAENYVGTLVTWFAGLDPVADPPPQDFNCVGQDLCATTALTEARARYRLSGTSSGGLDHVTTQGETLAFDLSQPFNVGFVPGTSFTHPGPNDPGPWWPAAVGSLGVAGLGVENRPFRIFVSDIEQRCGNGVAEPGEECDGNDLHGNTCEDLGFGIGDLACGRSCQYDHSDCSPPGCGGGPGEPNCDCAPVDNAPGCDIDEDGCFPDGPGSFVVAGQGTGLTCLDSFEGTSVCVFKKFAGDLVPVCQLCPARGGNGQAGYGCPCDRDSDCAPTGQAGPTSLDFSGPLVPLGCFGSSTEQSWAAGPGVCLPKMDPSGNSITSASLYGNNAVEEFERTRWLCKANCNSLEQRTNLDYACMYDQNPGIDFFNGACVDTGSCAGLLPGQCEEMGMRCDPTLEPEQCVEECSPNDNSPAGNPTCSEKWGYPPGYMCTQNWENPPRCVPSACAVNPLMTGLDLSWCEQFVNGGG